MGNNSCNCGHDHDEDSKEVEEHECCGGGCHDDANDEGCGCGHAHCEEEPLSPEDLAKLKKALLEAGYKVEETPEGELKVLED